MAPPLELHVSMVSERARLLYLHGDHLHVPALQTSVERILVFGDNGRVIGVDAELPAVHMFADWCWVSINVLVLLAKLGALSCETHVRDGVTGSGRVRSEAEQQRTELKKMKKQLPEGRRARSCKLPREKSQRPRS